MTFEPSFCLYFGLNLWSIVKNIKLKTNKINEIFNANANE